MLRFWQDVCCFSSFVLSALQSYASPFSSAAISSAQHTLHKSRSHSRPAQKHGHALVRQRPRWHWHPRKKILQSLWTQWQCFEQKIPPSTHEQTPCSHGPGWEHGSILEYKTHNPNCMSWRSAVQAIINVGATYLIWTEFTSPFWESVTKTTEEVSIAVTYTRHISKTIMCSPTIARQLWSLKPQEENERRMYLHSVYVTPCGRGA